MRLRLEFSDVLFALVCVANEANLDAEVSLGAAQKKRRAVKRGVTSCLFRI